MKKSRILEWVSVLIMVPTIIIALENKSVMGFWGIPILLGIMLVVTILLTYADWYKRNGR
jgi:hypothetical protein